ncbi:CCA tRNA nucleotidyltransferase [Paracoccus sp. DMF-8]|uniref:CCA tRNA nucleotidyltransferase n=1 Tax=Paracoccus sp. DMF-8 TaxID=3019445 RepID=UPI0023E7E3A5|nr:CCA tRNA nucleotidyltransferase [Paracoccus sp. DMF-8]MDF3606973.1 CCA tRNA nucleotidyltransferase [Paracoccus sp. DMF-8]
MLAAGGHQALIVGGAVRNALMGEPIADIDMASDAHPEQVMELARSAGLRTIPTGIRHGTVTLLTPDGASYEITTFRRDVETDGRNATVAYATDVAEDARRRDFTMNALYAQGDGTVLDPVGGLPDLRARRLRFIGQACDRIAEDYLRILRFFRFHAWYGRPGRADPTALAAIRDLAPGLARLSKERIRAELRKLLLAPDPVDALELMQDCGVLARVLPGARTGLIPDLIAAEQAAGLAPDWLLRLAALGGNNPRQALKLANDETAQLDELRKAGADSLQRTAFLMGADRARQLAVLRHAQGMPLPAGWRGLIDDASRQIFPLQATDLMPELNGPRLGRALNAARDHWIESDFQAGHDSLLDIARAAADAAPERKSIAKDA